MNKKIYNIFIKLSHKCKENLFKALERKEWCIIDLSKDKILGVNFEGRLPSNLEIKEQCGPWFIGVWKNNGISK